MTRSKLVQANERIAQKSSEAFGSIEHRVVTSFDSVENAFVERYLAHENESVEEAKKRLLQEKESRRQLQQDRKNSKGHELRTGI
ncbi:hypothetical protein KIM372_04660 [Bombiscardovia nodaiensis]|uniref:Uncharacterized protein n=1 Tax=Bombiscardovia nodaiensis TaxID=2932181 RepID=A0ABN6S8S4_9BIFI|nr:hypothetical protein KIM372_04660 [Bombiscardovia nodaiensis]